MRLLSSVGGAYGPRRRRELLVKDVTPPHLTPNGDRVPPGIVGPKMTVS